MVIDEGRFPGRQGRLLFAYLVAEQGRAVPRDELAEALWGDAPPATWDKALTVLVSKLRAVLSDGGIDGTAALTGAFGCYRLELPEGSWVDIIEAARAADEAETALSTGGPEQAKTAAVLAESLVRQPFLPGDDGAWVEEKRREIADVRVRALSVLAETCLRSGDGGSGEVGRGDRRARAVPRDWLPPADAGPRRRRQPRRGAARLRAVPAAPRRRTGDYPSPETESIYRGLSSRLPPGVVDIPTPGDEHEPRSRGGRGDTAPKTGLGRRGARRRRPGRRVAGIFATRAAGRTRRSPRTRSSAWTPPVRSQTLSRSERDRSRSLQVRGRCGSPTSTTGA